MDLHRLTMSNIGPFQGVTTVDFAALSSAGLFLLEGPTGSGKSTILDAIVFALYGSVATTTGGTDRMRSDRAEPGDESFVELTFEANSGVYRIRRNPMYERSKKSGTGTTTEKSAVAIWRLSDPDVDEGELLSSRSYEADLEVSKILGLNRAQFVQTVLLPQGEFAAFLRASATERQLLLQRLFGTELYDAMRVEFEQRRKTAANERASARESLNHRITAFVTAAECDDVEAEQIRAASNDELLQLIAASCDRHKGALERARNRHSEAAAASATAQSELETANTLVALHSRLAKLKQREAELLAQWETYRKRRAQLNRLSAANMLVPRRETLVAADVRLMDLSKTVSATEQTAISRSLEESVDDPETGAKRLLAQSESLSAIVHAEASLPDLEAAIADANAQVAQADSIVVACETERATLPTAIEVTTEALKNATAIAAQRPLAAERIERGTVRVEAARKASELIAQVASMRENVKELKAVAERAEATRGQFQRDRLNGIAGELALALVNGEPCVVCGSLVHPELAQVTEDHPTQRDVEAAGESAAEAVIAFEKAAAKTVEMDKQLAELLGASDGDIDQASAALESAEAELKAADEAAKEVATIETRLGAQQDRLAGLDAALRDGLGELAARSQELASLQAQFAAKTTQVADSLAGYGSVRERFEQLKADADLLMTLARGRQDAVEQTRLVSSLNEQWQIAVTESPFRSTSEFDDAVSQLDTLVPLTADVDQYEAQLRVVQDTLADPAFGELQRASAHGAPPTPDVAELERDLAKRTGEASAAAQALGHQQQMTQAVTEKASAVEKELRRVAAIDEGSDTLIRLADIVTASGPENLARVTLPTYVLVSRFKEVLSAANVRLDAMSDGRYSILYYEERESHGRKSGLGLSILDRHSDKQRAPGDLSGGETFYTALALALGLADVVVQEAGGLQLGTLFIDEGFGSLDPHTLDSVLAEIGKLRGGGRVVGVVSHVDELKQRISERIEVTRKSDGTSTLKVIA